MTQSFVHGCLGSLAACHVVVQSSAFLVDNVQNQNKLIVLNTTSLVLHLKHFEFGTQKEVQSVCLRRRSADLF